MIPSRQSTTLSDSVLTCIPGDTVVAHPMTGFGTHPILGLPSSSVIASPVSRSLIGVPISTKHMRQLPATLNCG